MKYILLMAILVVPFLAGCADSGGTAPVADGGDIAAYVNANPNSDAGTEVEGGDQ